MELQYVREFISLAETTSYFETATKLYVSTSALSRHIKSLEKDLGITLFKRTTRRVVLTEQGKLFLPYANRLINTENDWQKALMEMENVKRTLLKVGSIPTMLPYNITDIMAEFTRIYPEVTLDVKEADTLSLIPMVRSGARDFAFIRYTDDPGNEFRKNLIAEDILIAVIPSNHPLADQKSISLEALKDESLLFIEKDSYMYQLCTDLCVRSGFQPKVTFTSRRADNLLEMVAKGMGVAMLMKKAAASMVHRNDIRLVDIHPSVKTSIYLICKEELLSDPVAESFFLHASKNLS